MLKSTLSWIYGKHPGKGPERGPINLEAIL
jgi:hypothetical protein